MTDHKDLIERLREFPNAVLEGMPLYEKAADALAALSETVRLHARNVITAEMANDALQARVKRLETLLQEAIEYDGGVEYGSDYDHIGIHACCGSGRYKPHQPECWVPKARATLAEGDKP